MKKIATGTITALLIAATTSLAMAQGYQSPRYNDDTSGGYGAQSQPYSVNPNYYDSYDGSNYGARSQRHDVSPASPNAGIGQER
jgi:hypothetical protein